MVPNLSVGKQHNCQLSEILSISFCEIVVMLFAMDVLSALVSCCTIINCFCVTDWCQCRYQKHAEIEQLRLEMMTTIGDKINELEHSNRAHEVRSHGLFSLACSTSLPCHFV